jgi:hypothetical protein
MRHVAIALLCCSCGAGIDPLSVGEGEPVAAPSASTTTPAPRAAVKAPPAQDASVDHGGDVDSRDASLDVTVDVAMDTSTAPEAETPRFEDVARDIGLDRTPDTHTIDARPEAASDSAAREASADAMLDAQPTDSAAEASQDVMADAHADAAPDASDAAAVVLPLGCGPGERYTVYGSEAINGNTVVGIYMRDNQTGLGWRRACREQRWFGGAYPCEYGSLAQLKEITGPTNFAPCAWIMSCGAWGSELVQDPSSHSSKACYVTSDGAVTLVPPDYTQRTICLVGPVPPNPP